MIIMQPRVLVLMATLSTAFGVHAQSNTCTLETMKNNLAAKAEITSNPSTSLIEASDNAHFASNERRIACSEADLLRMGFSIKATWREGPAQSTNKGFEEMTIYELNELAVRCYAEYQLDAPGPSSKVLWSRYACQQIVPTRLKSK
jgi:hypothetical protein